MLPPVLVEIFEMKFESDTSLPMREKLFDNTWKKKERNINIFRLKESSKSLCFRD